MADIELAIQTTEMPLPKQHLFDTLSAVAGQGADEQRAAHPLRWSWTGGVPATLWSWQFDRLAARCATWSIR